MVENKSLAGASQRLGLYSLLYVRDWQLRNILKTIYNTSITTATGSTDTNIEPTTEPVVDCYEETLTEMPVSAVKTLADVYEALVGAIFIDCGMDYAIVNRVVTKSLRLNQRIQHIQEVCALLKEEM